VPLEFIFPRQGPKIIFQVEFAQFRNTKVLFVVSIVHSDISHCDALSLVVDALIKQCQKLCVGILEPHIVDRGVFALPESTF
jgi:hypothetical protein